MNPLGERRASLLRLFPRPEAFADLGAALDLWILPLTLRAALHREVR